MSKDNEIDVPVTALAPTSAITAVELAVTNLRDVTASVSKEIQSKLGAIIARTNPNKKGMEETQARWQVPSIRIKQPVTSSEACPDSARPGDLYTTAGELIKDLILTPIKFFERNDMFEKTGQKLMCSAPDAKLGNPLGWCFNPTTKEECPHLPMGKNREGRKTDCTNSLVIVAVDKDLKGIYEIQFSKTSRKAGSALQRLAGVGQTVWENWYRLTTEKKTGGQGIYYTYKISPTGEKVDSDVGKVCDALSDLTTAHRQAFIADYYGRRQGAADAAKATEQVDADALMAGLDSKSNTGEEPTFEDSPSGTATKKKKDYSKSL